MARFLLWNIGKRNLDLRVQSLVREHRIDVLLLIEYEPAATRSDLSNLLLQDGLAKRSTSEKFGVFGRLSHGLTLVETPRGGHAELWDWTPDSGLAGRFVLVHGLDRTRNDDGTRRVFFRRIADLVRQQETGSHRRSIVVGDFNAHPFESAILSSDGLHAIGIRQANSLSNRQVRWGEDREDFFYNPLWRMYGHMPLREAGMATHYWQNGLAAELFWHMLDQVVIRPEECARFPEEQLKILSTIGAVELVTPQGKLDDQAGSDHLPLVFEWNL